MLALDPLYFGLSYHFQFNTNYNYILLRSKKADGFEEIVQFSSSHSIVKRGYCVSRAPPHHNLPASLNLHDSTKATMNFFLT